MGGGIVLIAIVWGLLIVGSPQSGRLQRFDERKIQDLRVIHDEILQQVYVGFDWQPSKARGTPKELPKSLDIVAKNARSQKVVTVDPQSGLPYDYRIVNATTFELCAHFNGSVENEYNVYWNHAAGRQCFVENILNALR